MINSVVEYCTRNRFIVVVFFIVLVASGWSAMVNTPVDAIPDLSDNQVIIFTPYMGRSPATVEDQVTYPLETAMMGLPHVKDVRGQSHYGMSFIYVIFDDQVDIYFARSRVLERLSSAGDLLPEGVSPQLGPEGTGVGHVLWYVLRSDRGHNLAEMRSLQDWFVRYQLASVDGVAECASIGGFVKEYQVDLRPEKLREFGISSRMVAEALENANDEVGGRLLEQSDVEYFIRGEGYLKGVQDIENIVIAADGNGVPLLVKHVAAVQEGTGIRRGMLELNGEGEVAGGIIVMRYGDNAAQVIGRLKEKIEQVQRGLPEGVRIEVVYDRSELINRSIWTVRHTLIYEIIIVVLVIAVFLLDFRSSMVIVTVIPTAVLGAFLLMRAFNITSNIMSLMGIAVAIGVIVDDGIVLVENAQRHLSAATARYGRLTGQKAFEVVVSACKQVAKPVFFTTLIILLSFIPVFLLRGQEGKLFIPLAFTKSAVMLVSAVLAVTLTPVLMTFMLGRKGTDTGQNPVTQFFDWMYEPIVKWALRMGPLVIMAALAVMLLTFPIYRGLGKEFMPNLNEGELLFMPITLPNITVSEAKRILQVQDKIMMSHPQVKRVLGKVGRAETATDPAPVSMIETFVQLTDPETWPHGKTIDDIRSELDAKLKIPGVTNGWTMPIINRIQMLATGVRTDVGIKIYGEDLGELSRLALRAEAVAQGIPGAVDVFAERVLGGHYIDITVNREKAARYGLNLSEVQNVINTAIGGIKQTTAIEGRARYPIRIRYGREHRSDLEAVMDTQVMTPTRGEVPLRMVAEAKYTEGPSMISSENGLLRSLVFMNVRGRDLGSTVGALDKALSGNLELPPGYYYRISGQWENQVRAAKALSFILPLVLLVILVLLYLTFNSLTDALIVMLSVPFALVGGVLLLASSTYNLSVAVWVGFIALFGVAVNTGVLMMVYLNEAMDRVIAEKGTEAVGRADILRAAYEGSAMRLRPKLMTVATSLFGLLPIMWATGAGSEVMRPIAIPLVGGLISSTILVLLVIPVVFSLARWVELRIKGKLAPRGSHAGLF